MAVALLTGHEGKFAFGLFLSLIAGYIIGIEREARGKPAGVSTHALVIAGSMFFTFISPILSVGSEDRIAAGIITGIGFLGAGVIFRGRKGTITNLTSAAGIWLSAAIGMALGAGFYLIAFMMVLFSIVVPRIPNISAATAALRRHKR